MSGGVAFTDSPLRDVQLTQGVSRRRIFAFIVDGMLLLLLSLVLATAVAAAGPVNLHSGFTFMHLALILSTLYFAFWPLTRGAATPGQTMLGLTIRQDRTLDSPNPERPKIVQALVWSILLQISMGLSMLPMLLILFPNRRRHRAAHDFFAGVTIVNRSALSSSISWL